MITPAQNATSSYPLNLLFRDASGTCHFADPGEGYDYSCWTWPKECEGANLCFVGSTLIQNEPTPLDFARWERNLLKLAHGLP